MNILYICLHYVYIYVYYVYIYVIQAASLWEKVGSLVIANPPSKSWVCSKKEVWTLVGAQSSILILSDSHLLWSLMMPWLF